MIKCCFTIIDIGNTALSAAYALVKLDQAWWNVLSTSFQYVCVLLAIDTPESLSHVATAMKTLDNITQILGTRIAFEAQKTAKLLLEDSMKKKDKKFSSLSRQLTRDLILKLLTYSILTGMLC